MTSSSVSVTGNPLRLRRRNVKWLHAVAIIIACGGSPVVSSHSQAVTLEDIQQRATAYVVVYQQALTSLVANERYMQILHRERGGGQRRDLVSEVAMVRGGAQSDWVMFRDVLEVDGRVIRNREQRLLELLRSPAPDALAAARRIAEESARFNIGRLTRTFNVPDMALSFLRPENATRIRYHNLRSEVIDGVRHFVFRFRELHGPTIIRAPEGTDLPAEAGSGSQIRVRFDAPSSYCATTGRAAVRPSTFATTRQSDCAFRSR